MELVPRSHIDLIKSIRKSRTGSSKPIPKFRTCSAEMIYKNSEQVKKILCKQNLYCQLTEMLYVFEPIL
jgi:hypothetical protein